MALGEASFIHASTGPTLKLFERFYDTGILS